MKTLVLGDIHGRTCWKDITSEQDYDKVVFLGDYFDTHESISYPQQIENFENMLSFKVNYPEKVVLLLGNHDNSYFADERCSGYSPKYANTIKSILQEADDLGYLQVAYIQGDILITHAGVSQYWLTNVAYLSDASEISMDDKYSLLFNHLKGGDSYGNSISQGPLWIRPEALLQSAVKDYRQIVGHTRFSKPVFLENIYFNDLLPSYYIVIEEGAINYIDNGTKEIYNNNPSK